MAEAIIIADYESWGRLVKTWATGKNYLAKEGGNYKAKPDPDPAGSALFPWPKSIEEFTEQARRAGAIASNDAVPASLTSIQFVQGDMATLVIRLPARGRIEASEAEIAAGRDYRLPDIYQRVAFGGTAPNIANPMVFNHMRIGDYTVTNCM